MASDSGGPLFVLCLASYHKGLEFMRECYRAGARVALVTRESLRAEEWPWESLGEAVFVPDHARPEDYLVAADSLARRMKIDRVVALEEYDVRPAAAVREHLVVPGMGGETALNFRDKLTMRHRAAEAGVAVPDFVHALNRDEVEAFLARVAFPCVLKPRSDVSAMGVRKLFDAESARRALDQLDGREAPAERSPFFVLEQYVAGDVYHVDSLIEDGRVIFDAAYRYWRTPMDVAHRGGVFLTSSIQIHSDEENQLKLVNSRVIRALGLRGGAAHAEFIRGERDGRFYFLEAAARVGGAFIAETIEAATGVNLWRAWARLELGLDPLPTKANDGDRVSSGIALSLARQEYPDTSAYTDEEIVYRVNKRHHVGLIVRSARAGRVEELLGDYARRFQEDFCAVLPPLERPPG